MELSLIDLCNVSLCDVSLHTLEGLACTRYPLAKPPNSKASISLLQKWHMPVQNYVLLGEFRLVISFKKVNSKDYHNFTFTNMLLRIQTV